MFCLENYIMSEKCKELESQIFKIHNWLMNENYLGYDPYDLSYLNINKLANKGYFLRKFFRLIQKVDYNFPKILRTFLKKRGYPYADCLIGEAYLKLYILKKDKKFLKLAKYFANKLIKSNQIFWGLPFDWDVPGKKIKKNTACSTVTVPVINFLLNLYEVTNIKKYKNCANLSIKYLLKNLNITYDDNFKLAYSYTPKDNFIIINSNSYLLQIISRVNDNNENKKIITKLLNFIISEQNKDGSWDYWSKMDVNYRRYHCVDTLHNCYILQNLILANNRIKNKKLNSSIKRGTLFLKRKLVVSKTTGYIYKFPKLNINKISTPDLCELIKVFILYNSKFKEIDKIKNYIVDYFFDPKGYFYFEKNKIKYIKQPYIRYVEAPCFLVWVLLLERCYENKKKHTKINKK